MCAMFVIWDGQSLYSVNRVCFMPLAPVEIGRNMGYEYPSASSQMQVSFSLTCMDSCHFNSSYVRVYKTDTARGRDRVCVYLLYTHDLCVCVCKCVWNRWCKLLLIWLTFISDKMWPFFILQSCGWCTRNTLL